MEVCGPEFVFCKNSRFVNRITNIALQTKRVAAIQLVDNIIDYKWSIVSISITEMFDWFYQLTKSNDINCLNEGTKQQKPTGRVPSQ